MLADSNTYAFYYYDCRRNKINRLCYKGMLKSFLLLLARWRDISVDFISPLLIDKRPLSYLKWYKSEGFDMIIIVVDRLTKIRYYTLYRKDIKT
jgi:hypothetical protein